MKLGHKRARKAFTLIELSFAIGFISVLLITITLITNEIIQIYRKGYNIKSINQVGRDVIDDFQNSIIQSSPSSLASFCATKYPNESDQDRKDCDANHGLYSVYQQYYTSVKVLSGGSSADYKEVPTGGIFCSGKYTYIWNTGYIYNTKDYAFRDAGDDDNRTEQQNSRNKHKLIVKYKYRDNKGEAQEGSNDRIRLIRVEDATGSICASTLENGYPSAEEAALGPGGTTNYEIEVRPVLSNEPEEILAVTDADLVFYDLVLFEPARVTGTEKLLFSGSFILGTIGTGVDIMSSSNYCQTPTYFTADFSYCAINKFNFIIQSSSK
ncbi:hypothetical protein IKG06_02215 [Candidatus Saccharibacteria bacterium]|nr:hypothetical protein [Candidatus Saccharibacteria bacterium]